LSLPQFLLLLLHTKELREVIGIMADEKHHQEELATTGSLMQQKSAGLHHDHIAEEALGGHTADLGRSYFTSLSFIGTVIVRLYS
jgi:hypothetical protein